MDLDLDVDVVDWVKRALEVHRGGRLGVRPPSGNQGFGWLGVGAMRSFTASARSLFDRLRSLGFGVAGGGDEGVWEDGFVWGCDEIRERRGGDSVDLATLFLSWS